MSGTEDTVHVSVRVQPGAAKDEVMGFTDGILKVRVTAPPVKGRANKALIELLSQLLNIGKSQLNIIRGHSSRNKVIAISGLSREEVMKLLAAI